MNASAVFLRCYVNQRLTRCARLLLASALNLSRVLFHLFSKYYLESICNSPSRRWAKKKRGSDERMERHYHLLAVLLFARVFIESYRVHLECFNRVWMPYKAPFAFKMFCFLFTSFHLSFRSIKLGWNIV